MNMIKNLIKLHTSPVYLCILAFAIMIGWVIEGTTGSVVQAVAAFFFSYLICSFLNYSGWRAAHRSHIEACEGHSNQLLTLLTRDKTAPASITMAEQNIVDALIQVNEDFDKLAEEHNGEKEEFDRLLHAAIVMVFARTGYRSSVAFKLLGKYEAAKQSA
jgi:hypothetical protein